jgi:cell shape-determining protein MreC
MDYLPQDQSILVGDIVVTSGEGGNFPVGIPVGQVVEVEQNDIEMFQRAVVRTTVDFIVREARAARALFLGEGQAALPQAAE